MLTYKKFFWILAVLLLRPLSAIAGEEPGRQYCSGTLPIMFINSEAPITSKEDYVNATCYIDGLGLEGYESLGTAESPMTLSIKGHGNLTWKAFDKKPYRLKFKDKVEPLGLKKNSHFTLLPHVDDDLVYLRNTVGFELSRLIGMSYTPAQEPVEVVLNGDYVGLYMMTEKIRLGKNRVEITQQDDLATDPAEITGGWLLEMDNYLEDGQIYLSEGELNQNSVIITIHDPDEVSQAQRSYITRFLEETDRAIHSQDKTSRDWEKYIDIDTLARYFIIREMVDDTEAFRGSCYIHKERGNDTKLVFGPVWDFGESFRRTNDQFVWQDSPSGYVWIDEIYKFPRFKERVIDIWQPFLGMQYPKLDKVIDDFIERIREGINHDLARWPKHRVGKIDTRKQLMKKYLAEKVGFLTKEWGEGIADGITSPVVAHDHDSNWYTLDGRRLHAKPSSSGLYLHGHRKVVVR